MSHSEASIGVTRKFSREGHDFKQTKRVKNLGYLTGEQHMTPLFQIQVGGGIRPPSPCWRPWSQSIPYSGMWKWCRHCTGANVYIFNYELSRYSTSLRRTPDTRFTLFPNYQKLSYWVWNYIMALPWSRKLVEGALATKTLGSLDPMQKIKFAIPLKLISASQNQSSLARKLFIS